STPRSRDYRMAHMPKEPEAFGEQVAHIFRRNHPDKPIELVGPMDLVVAGKHLGLENLYRMVQCEPGRGVEIVESYLDRLVEGDNLSSLPLPLSVAKPRIMPRIQPVTIFNHLDREQVAHIPFVNDTVVVFVLDMPHMTVSITIEQLMRWGVTTDDVDLIARDNLRLYNPKMDVHFVDSAEGGRAAIVSLQDGYDAARILLDTLYRRLAPELNGDFFVATPARDMFLAFTCNPEPFVSRLQKRVEQDYRRLPYPITDAFFVVTRDGVAGTRSAAA
ncbi:MAG TPA: DUF1444 family protein, partial [Phycisphaerales bacterium]|nr:DUF1444 family protein [Phycisphaerales bacterium]